MKENDDISYKFGSLILGEYKYESFSDKNGQIRIAPFVVLEDNGEELLCVKGSKNVKTNVSRPKILYLKSLQIQSTLFLRDF